MCRWAVGKIALVWRFDGQHFLDIKRVLDEKLGGLFLL